ncbi:MAG: S1 family peptidase [Pseudodesulfovibrio sp.]|uniref:Uncharacterized protein n=1 Tax=Pseudodesulfovibrio aespoeensis (strain ATCC 700646 / DSM 10631 / Aspo-2) TaxID=643562 RepID=E6VYX5_PSEA9|nr:MULTISPECIES: hypothetical protein [Pseudodesulfovibrio]MBU4378797.1 S1 family peptidase [Pseudomonadota bacterium]MCG2741049.1 S1 family peptidase [Syntrophaceae bacterium]ADU61638.1 hypothetical protein Daes_0620 [Pseudodesulfovibrio aespoeensis Aspo-2]MBU4473731.1 S1 family peptidase [Pseudomonadota bacterium]MBV1764721.1 S1 family peptidase [Pseudodesulfovibrio sp.]
MKRMRIGEMDFEAVRLSQEELVRVDAVHAEAVERLLDRRVRNVVGVGRAHKWVNGRALPEACIQVQVVEKVDADELADADLIPLMIGNVKTDVVAVGELEFHALTAKVRPLESGYSLGATHQGKKSTGTLGGFAQSVLSAQQHYFVLSCNHVLAKLGAFPLGVEVTQPGPNDGGVSADAVGQLWSYSPMSTTQDNPVDAALATVEEDMITPVRPYVPGFLPAKDIVIGMAVLKNGRTTELTTGVVVADKVTVEIGGYRMVDQVTATYGCAGGDSGSLVLVRDNNKAVGLHFAGSSVGGYMNTIENVLAVMKVSLY